MSAVETSLGCSALLRVAGLPIRYWLSGANPGLFDKVERLEVGEEQYRARAARLAEQIGERLIPNPALSRDDRALLLAIRRRLHRGEPIEDGQYESVLRVAGSVPDLGDRLVLDIVSICNRGRGIARSWAEVSEELVCEQGRLWRLPAEIVRDSPVARALLQPAHMDDGDLAAQPGVKQRRRFEYMWRRIARAATASTPRDWFSHVALLEVEQASSLPAPAVTATFAANWTENVRSRRRALAKPPSGWPEPDSLIAVNPLHWEEDGHFVGVVLDQHEEPTQVAVRHMPLLDAICAALEAGPQRFVDVQQALGHLPEGERLALPGFIRYLVDIGILQPIALSPSSFLDRQARPGKTFANPAITDGSRSGWVDVYRYADGAISADIYADLQQGVLRALRLLRLMRSGSQPPLTAPDSRQSWPFTEILRAELRAAGSPELEHERVDESPKASASSSFAVFVDRLEECIGDRATLDIDEHLLDDLGAPKRALTWPVDCLMRLAGPGADFSAVLEQFWPPGRGDARFAETLAELHGSVPQVDAYRTFLQDLEQKTGILFVELLAPPLADGAANAVRRPVYTRAWTGDPDTPAYLPRGASPGRYIPLQAIRLRRVERRLRAEVDGELVWPIYHATRSFSPPWDRLARVLLATAPYDVPWAYGRFEPFTLFPGRRAFPRITVGRGIVLSPACWRLSAAECWDKAAPMSIKIRAVLRLRERLSLPRWLHLVPDAAEQSVPCDLESLPGIRAIERCLGAASSVCAAEMLPAPNQLLVEDRAHRKEDRLVSELHGRFPCDETPTVLAARLAPEILESVGLGAASCRGPPDLVQLRTAKSADDHERSYG